MIILREYPLALDGWLQFNEYKWKLKPSKLRFNIDNKEVPSVEAIVYLDRRGRIVMPPLNPYLPVSFYPSQTNKVYRLRRQWLSVSGLFADALQKRVYGAVSFPPDIIDVREFQWRGFLIEPRYTFYLTLPLDLSNVDHMVRKQINKALSNGFQIQRSLCFEKVIECLADTERRQGFTYHLNINDLHEANRLIGEDNFRCYVAIAPNSEVASARIILKGSGSHAVDWVAGTKKEFLNSGITQYLISYALEDLVKDGITTFDFAGANLPTVQAAKSSWGGELKVYYVLRQPSIRALASISMRFLKSFIRRD